MWSLSPYNSYLELKLINTMLSALFFKCGGGNLLLFKNTQVDTATQAMVVEKTCISKKAGEDITYQE